MLDTIAGRGALSLFDGTHETPVTGVSGGTLTLADEIARRAGRFLIIWQRGVDRIELPVSGSVREDGRSVALDEVDLGVSLARAGDGVGRALIDTALGVELPARGERRFGRLLLRLAVAAACVVLLAYNGYRLYHLAVTITPSMAYLATEVSTINAPTSGTLTFAAGPGNIAKGEPIIGIENARGKTILVDASDDVRIVMQDRQVGDVIKRGEPVLAVADSDPPTFIIAIMTREEAFRLSAGANVHYSFLHEPESQARHIHIAGDAFSLSMMPPTSASTPPLYRVRFRIPSESLARGEPIVVSFQQHLTDRATTLLNGLGVEGAVAAPIIAGIAWLEDNVALIKGGEA